MTHTASPSPSPRTVWWGLGLGLGSALAACGTPTAPGGPDTANPPSSHGPDLGSVVVETLSCADPAAAFAYTESGAELGLLDTTDGDSLRMMGNPLVLADLDDDGDDDLVLATRYDGIWLQRNDGGSLPATALTDTREASSLALGDLDGDGDLDLVAAGLESPVVLLNDGEANFSVLPDAGLEGLWAFQRDVSLGDVDGDGDLDLFATADPFGHPEGSVLHTLWENDGTAHFRDQSDTLPAAARTGLGWHTVLTDLDGDLDVDLFISNADQNEWGPNRLLLNDGPGEVGIAWRDATESCSCGMTRSAMGASVGDVNRDGLPDLYITQSGPSVLLQNLGDGEFADTTAAYGAATLADPSEMTFGSLLFDHDNDGWLDIAAVAGPMGGPGPIRGQPELQTNALLAGHEGGFEDLSAALGFADPAPGRAVAAGYLNDDPFLDVVVSHLDAPSRIYLSTCTAARAVVVELRGRASAPFGEGARVELHTGDTVLTQWISSNPGWAAAMHPRAHFGLGEMDPERLVVHWPAGAVQEVPLALDGSARVRVTEPDREPHPPSR